MTTLPPSDGPAPANGSDRNWAVVAHLCGLLCWWTTLGHLVGPLVIWLLKRGESPFVEKQAKEALNAQISFSVYAFVAALLIWVLIGFVLLPVVLLFAIICSIRGAFLASEGRFFRYPLIFRLVS